MGKLNEKSFDKVQQPLKNSKENKNRRPLKLTTNMIINVKPLKSISSNMWRWTEILANSIFFFLINGVLEDFVNAIKNEITSEK